MREWGRPESAIGERDRAGEPGFSDELVVGVGRLRDVVVVLVCYY